MARTKPEDQQPEAQVPPEETLTELVDRTTGLLPDAPSAPAPAVDDDKTPMLAPAPQPTGDVRSVEEWAEKKGLLPEFISSPQPFARPDAPLIRSHNPKCWQFAAAKAGRQWPIGMQMTEADFDAAIREATTTHSYR